MRHWFSKVEDTPGVDRVIRVLVPEFAVSVAGGREPNGELAYGNDPSVAPHALVADLSNICWRSTQAGLGD